MKRCTTEEKTALQTVSNTLLVAQRIFTAFAVSILSELSGDEIIQAVWTMRS